MSGPTEDRSTATSLRILIVDDHPMVREGLRDLLQREADLAVCGLASSGAEALMALGLLDPDLIVLDLSLGDRDGTRLIREIVQRSPRALILVLSTYEDGTYAERCIRAGARGYLNKRAAAMDVRGAVRVVAEGGIYRSAEAGSHRAAPPCRPLASDGGRNGPEALSDRELEVFQLLGRGCGPSQIAESMGLSVRTVESYEARIKIKLGLANADELHRFSVNWYRGPDR